jgi:antitoxin PrlF
MRYVNATQPKVVLSRVDAKVDDPVLGQFLGFLARGIASHPEHLQVLDSSFVQRIQSLTGGIEVDLDAPLLADYE